LYKWEYKEKEETGGENGKRKLYFWGRKELCKTGKLLFKMNLWQRKKLLN